MPKYTPEQLQKLNPEDTQSLLEDVGSLIENRESLEKLSDNEKKDLIFKMLSNNNNLKSLSHITDALRHPTVQKNNSFPNLFSRALVVCRHLDSITDVKNPNPGHVFVGNEFNADSYNEFATLVQHRLSGKEDQIAQRLAKSPDSHAEIAKSLRILSLHPTGDVFKTINAKLGKLVLAKKDKKEEEELLLEEQLLDDEVSHTRGCCVLI